MNLKGETDSNTGIVENFNTPLTTMDWSSRQKINKEIVAINDTLDQTDLIDIFRVFHLQSNRIYIFSSVQKTFSEMHHMLEHKTSLNKFKKIEIISSIISDNFGMKLEINNTKKPWKTHKCIEAK